MFDLMLHVVAAAHAFAVHAHHRLRQRADERGQATAEYALVLLGVAAVALLVVSWAAKTDRIGSLLDRVFDRVKGRA